MDCLGGEWLVKTSPRWLEGGSCGLLNTRVTATAPQDQAMMYLDPENSIRDIELSGLVSKETSYMIPGQKCQSQEEIVPQLDGAGWVREETRRRIW